MDKPILFVQSSCLATQEKIDGRELACGKISNNPASDNFLFYLIEVNSTYPNSKVIKKTIQILENNCKTNGYELADDNFEKILQNVNEGLARLAESGENGWIGNLNAIIGLVNHNELLMSQTGNITGYIFRKNKISAIAEKNSVESNFHPLKTFTEITAGQMIASDHIVFGNFDLFSRISLDRIRTITAANDFHKEIIELHHYLRKHRVKDVNAIVIYASNKQADPAVETVDTLFIDAQDETLKKMFQKHILPVAQKTKLFVVEKTPIVVNHLKKLHQSAKKGWNEKVAPASKKFIDVSSQKISGNLADVKTKMPEFKALSENKGLKIKARSYQKNSDSKLTSFLKAAWEIIKNLKLLFLKENRKYLYSLLIVIFVIFGYMKLKANNDQKSAKTKEVQLLNSYDKANENFGKIKEDIALGKNVDNSAINDALIMAQKSSEIPANKENADKLVAEIKQLFDERTRTVRFDGGKSSNFADGLISLALSGNIIYGINAEGKIYTLDTREAEGKLIASLSADYGTPISMAIQKSKLIISTEKNRLFAMDLDTKTIAELKINAEPNTWSYANALATYSTNIYVLSSDNGVVWKHSVIDGGYSKGTSYLDTKKTSIRGAVDFAIDGNIYVLTNDGTVDKFVKGSPESDFSIKNIPLPNDKILIPKQIFTDEDTNSLFVLDKKFDRIIKFDKSGDYNNQYILDNKSIDNFVVNAKLQKIWILSGGKIFEGNL